MFSEISEVERNTIYFKCSRCGKCCHFRGDLLITPMDLFRYCQFLHMTTVEFLEQYARIEESSSDLFKIFLKDKGDILRTCIFFDNDMGCSINPIKPPICYFYPFFVNFFTDDKTTVQITDCVMSSLNNSSNKKEERIIDLVEKASGNRYHSEKILMKKYIELISSIHLALASSSDGDSKKKKHTQKFFEDFYINLDLSDEHYIEKKIEEWQDIVIFI